MIYLIQDCYKDNNGNYNDVLKIGYSKEEFSKIRQSQYSTHNYGYKLLGEKEGSLELENYIHKILKDYNLSGEWFRYDQEVINKFWKLSENDLSTYTSQNDLNEYIRYFILKNLVPTTDRLKDLYLDKILNEIKDQDPEYRDNENDYRKEILKVFEFVSSREQEYFTNLDFNSEETIKILEDCDLIVGRQRDKSNPFKNDITIFYRTIRKGEIQDRALFDLEQEGRRKETKKLLDLYEVATSEQKITYLKKLRADIEVSSYSNDFVSISKKTGQPVYNSLIEIANERAWEVSQVDYQDKISVTKSLESISSDISEYKSDLEKEIHKFFDSRFFTTGVFEKKMKIYCEIMDIYRGDKEVEEILRYKTKDSRFQKYYKFYGSKGCKTLKYREKYLEQGMINQSKDSLLSSEIYKKFLIGSKYTLKEIKSILQGIHDSLGITTKPKATDLENILLYHESDLQIQLPKRE